MEPLRIFLNMPAASACRGSLLGGYIGDYCQDISATRSRWSGRGLNSRSSANP